MDKTVFYTTPGGIKLYATRNYPDPVLFPGPRPYWGSFHAGGLKSGSAGPHKVSLSAAFTLGAIACDVEYRLAPPHQPMNTPAGDNGYPAGQHDSPGQDTTPIDDGQFPVQFQDVAQWIIWARAQADCDGRVILYGGSAGASHALMLACIGRTDDDGTDFYGVATGASGNTKPDFIILCSIGLSSFSDENMWALACDPLNPETCPHEAVANYLHIADPAPDAPVGADLVLAVSASPLNYLRAPSNNGLPPLIAALSSKDSISIPNSNGENITAWTKGPPSIEIFPAESGANGLKPALVAAGYEEITGSTMPEAGKYHRFIVPVLSHSHAGEYWDLPTSTPPSWGPTVVLPLVQAFLDNTDVVPPPPPPENNLLYYEATLTGGPPDFLPRSGTIPAVITKEATSFQITDLEDNKPYRLTLRGVNQYGKGDVAFFDFQSNPAVATGEPKTKKKGNYYLFDAAGGAPSDPLNVATHPFWNNPIIDGSRWRTGWAQIEAVKWVRVWDDPDNDLVAYLDFCTAKGKYAGIGISSGINFPPWLHDEPGYEYYTSHGPKTGEIPIYWNPVVLANWINFIQAFGDQFDAHPALAYVVPGGLGQLIESFIAGDQPGQGGDYDFLEANAISHGFLDKGQGAIMTAWNFAVEAIISAYSAAFPTTPIVFTADIPVKTHGGEVQVELSANWMKENFAGERMGFMNAGLNGATNHQGSYPISRIIWDGRGEFLTGYQFGHGSNDPRCDPTQTGTYDALLGYQHALEAGYVEQKVEFLEIYPGDEERSDPDADPDVYDPDYEDLTAAAQAGLKLN